jgi:hypothetical protein
VSASGGRPEAATTLSAADKESSHRWPVFLPDGRHFLLLSQPGNVIRVGSLDSPESKRLLSAESRAEYASGYLLFARSETLFAQPFDVRKLETTAEALPIVEGIRTNALNGRAAFTVSPSGDLAAYRSGRRAGAGPVDAGSDRTGRRDRTSSAHLQATIAP